jgi:DNA-binding response OmpR family regulator
LPVCGRDLEIVAELAKAGSRNHPLLLRLKGRGALLMGTESAGEYSFLRLLARHAGKVVTHRQILKEVWGPAYGEQTHYLRVYVAHLREKLETDPARPELLLTEPGVGYRLVAEP